MDERIFRLVNGSLSGPVLDDAMVFLSSSRAMRPVLLVFVLVALVFGGRKGRLVLIGALLVAGATDLASSGVLKHAVGRERPCAAMEEVLLPGGRCPKSASFPSSHAANSFSLATYVSLNYPWAAAIGFPLAAGVAFSRVYLGVHYPSDVVAGAGLGALIALALAFPLRRARRAIFPSPSPPALQIDKGLSPGGPPTLAERAQAALGEGHRFGYRHAFYALLAVSTLANLAIIALDRLDLAPDEAHYWLWSRSLDWSYYSKGPAVAWLIAASTRLGGDSPFFLRLPAVLLSVGSAFLVFHIGRRLLGGDGKALLAVVCLRAAPLFAVGGLVMTIDPPFLFFWAAAMAAFLWALHGAGGLGSWLALGGAIGLGILSKYTMAIFIPLAGACLIWAPKLRPWLRRPGPYLACLLAAALSMPILVWNVRHDWISFRHVSSLAEIGTGREGIHLGYLFEFLLGQLAVLSPLIAAGMAWAVYRSARRAIAGREPIDVILACFSAPIFLLFLGMSLRGRVHPNWPAPAWVAGSIVLAREVAALHASLGQGQRRKLSRWAEGAIAVGLACTAIGGSPALAHLLAPHLPPDWHPTVRLEGWRELGLVAGRIQEEMGGPERTFLLSNTYQAASELAFYTPGRPRTFNARFTRRLNQFDFWPGLETVIGKDAVYVTMGEKERPKPVFEGFDRCEREPTLRIVRSRQVVRSFSLFRCYGFRGFPRNVSPIRY